MSNLGELRKCEPQGPPPQAVRIQQGSFETRSEPLGPPPSLANPSNVGLFSAQAFVSADNEASPFRSEPSGPPPSVIGKRNEPSRPPPVPSGSYSSSFGASPAFVFGDQNKLTGNEPAGPPPTSSTNSHIDDGPVHFGRVRLDAAVSEQQANPKKRSQRDFDEDRTREPSEGNSQEQEEGEDEEEVEEPAYKFEPAKFVSLVVEDSHKLAQRQKQIDIGKNTIGYQNYIERVPKQLRQKYNKIHPVTPDIKDATVSKRQFDGLVKAWRRALHFWDVLPGQEAPERTFVPHNIRQMNKKMRLMAAKASKMETEEQVTSAAVQASADTNGAEKSIFDDFDL